MMRGMPRSARAAILLCTAWLVLWQAHALGLSWIPVGPATWIHLVVMAIGAGLCFARAAAERSERLAWTLIGSGLAFWIAGETYFTVVLWDDASPPVPSPADLGFLLFPPFMFAGIILLLRSRVRGLPRMLWVDGVTAALAVGAVSAAVVVETVLDASAGGDRLAVITNLAYPVADLVLVGLIVGAVAARGWRVDRTLGLLLAGVFSFWLSDSLYLVLTAKGTWESGGAFDAGWWATAVVLGAAAWQPATRRTMSASRPGAAHILAPIGFALAGLAVLIAGSAGNLNMLAIGLAAASLTAVLARLLLTLRENLRMLRVSRDRGAHRRADGPAATGARLSPTSTTRSTPTRPTASRRPSSRSSTSTASSTTTTRFGHPAGDALLQRLGDEPRRRRRGPRPRLPDGRRRVLRPARHGGAARPRSVAARSAALSESRRGLHDRLLARRRPAPRGGARRQRRAADRRPAHVRAQARRPALGAAPEHRGVLLRVLAERDPELSDHVADVAALAERVARRARASTPATSSTSAIAAELHDVGKVAIPDAILRQARPARRRRVGASCAATRSSASASSAARPGAARRSPRSCARATSAGTARGYPDGLGGEDIPLGARIVAVCDAFDAMTKRPPLPRRHAPPRRRSPSCAAARAPSSTRRWSRRSRRRCARTSSQPRARPRSAAR